MNDRGVCQALALPGSAKNVDRNAKISLGRIAISAFWRTTKRAVWKHDNSNQPVTDFIAVYYTHCCVHYCEVLGSARYCFIDPVIVSM